MSNWEFTLDQNGIDTELELELYQDKRNVVVITLSAKGLAWAAMVNGQSFSGKLTGVKCKSTLGPPPDDTGDKR